MENSYLMKTQSNHCMAFNACSAI